MSASWNGAEENRTTLKGEFLNFTVRLPGAQLSEQFFKGCLVIGNY